MAYDIMSPLLLVPDFDILYVIDMFDRCYASDTKTFKRQKQDIKDILINGNDDNSHSKKIHENYSHIRMVHYLETPSTIIDESDDGYTWRLKFNYNDKVRELIFFHHRNFLIEWPSEIQNISHIMCMGAYAWDNFPEQGAILEMFKNRTTKPFWFYALHFMHEHFPEFIHIYNGKEREGKKIAKVKIDSMDNFKELVYEPKRRVPRVFKFIHRLKKK